MQKIFRIKKRASLLMKFDLKMKLTTLFLIVSFFQLQAAGTYAQKTKVSLDLKNVSLGTVLDKIESLSDFKFIYTADEVDYKKNVTVKANNERIYSILQKLFLDTPIIYKVLDKQIILKRDTSKKEKKSTEVLQKFQVSGGIFDASGAPLPGASVLEKGTSNGTQSDFDGKFTLNLSNENAVLIVSFISFKTVEIPVDGRKSIKITLQEDTKLLEEVVVVGYGTQKKATLSGAVSSLKGDELKNVPVTNVSQGIAGRIPGVVAISNGGEPGYDGATLRIRGVNTFGDSSPLIVVDGVPGRSLERIDPNTIESVSVLKDASAAIYGAQAANGVILITTKRGKTGKPMVQLSLNKGYSQPTRLPKMTNAAEYATLLNEVDKYANRPERYSADDLQKYQDGSDPWGHPNTDWYKETLKNLSAQNNANLSISGGTEDVKYFVSISSKSQDGFYKNSATKYEQYDFKSNLDLKVNKYASLYVNTTARMEDRNFSSRSAENIFRMIMRSKPNQPAYWPNGLPGPDVEFGDNPVVITTDATGYNRDKRYVLNSDFGLNLKIPGVEGLSVKANASLDKTFRFNKIWETPWYLYTWDQTSYDANGEPLLIKGQKGFSDPRLTESMEDNQRILVSGVVNYSKTFLEDHNINLLAGVEKITGKGDSFNAFRRNFISTSIDQLFAGGQDQINNSGSGYQNARLNYFGKVNYSYRDKYLAEFLWRYQASYIFEKSSRYGFFPGVSLGYVLSKENFWQKTFPVINFAKLRMSYGKTGNDLIAPYQYLASYSFNNLLFIDNGGATKNQGLYEGVVPNTGVTWETATQSNVGIDLHFFDGKLALTTDYFINKRDDILWARNASVPSTAGLSLPAENIGKFKNQGLDFSLDYKNKSNDFSYSVGINGVFTKNKILFWDEAPGTPDYQQTTGKPLGAGLFYQAIGVFKDQAAVDAYPHWGGARPGDIIFLDYNEDGKIDGNDRVRNDKTGAPTFTGGLNFDMSYKGFDFALLFQGAAGGVFYETTESGDFANYLKSFHDNRWTEDNPNASFPRTYNRTSEYWVNQQNTFWLHKTDYIRLKSIELGYTIPKSFTSKYYIENLRIYTNAFNLLTYSPGMKDYDPENTNGSGYNYPLNKVFNFGLSVTF
ncbi:TonB-linked outer membrane protein, SusC/RagA family [Flavobacterium daejeonense]|nr:TonB-linked outer membrane protein, SusC/RagA family [Flavobacterium daejeonense]